MSRKQILTDAQKLRKYETARIRYSANPEKYRLYNRKSYQKHIKKRRERDRINGLKDNYGLTAEQYDNMIRVQNNLCAICNQHETSTYKGKIKRLSVDHNHSTNTVRELLCDRCNRMLAAAKEEPFRLEQGILYLKRHKEVEKWET